MKNSSISVTKWKSGDPLGEKKDVDKGCLLNAEGRDTPRAKEVLGWIQFYSRVPWLIGQNSRFGIKKK